MNLARIEDSLKRLFTDEDARWARGARRIVFWYDAEAQFTEAFATLELPDVQKVVLDHAPFNLKYRLQVLEPDASFLIYAPFAQPPPLDNWLLDVELYSASFSAEGGSPSGRTQPRGAALPRPEIDAAGLGRLHSRPPGLFSQARSRIGVE